MLKNSVMSNLSIQSPSAVVMVRPHGFTPNPQTLTDNAFQQPSPDDSAEYVAGAAFREVTHAMECLRGNGVAIHLFEDNRKKSPDSVFPNNWFSTHPGGEVVLYPMRATNRRQERRVDILDFLEQHYRVSRVIDYSSLEMAGMYLEGTGAMVLDHASKVAYAAESCRAHPGIFDRFCSQLQYEPHYFSALDKQFRPIYHTNVMMSIATDFALIGDELIIDRQQRTSVLRRLEESGREVISLSASQIFKFAGNALELQGKTRRLLALSGTAYRALTDEQKARIERHATLLPLEVPTLEMAGGSVRCMLAGIHLRPKA